MNEVILILYSVVVCGCAGIALALGLEALVAYAALLTVLMNLFVTKQIALFGLSATAADALAIGSTIALNLIQEYISRDQARKAIWICFFSAAVYVACSMLHLWYVPLATDTMDVHFKALLWPMPRIIAASFTSYLIAQHVEWALYGFFKQRLKAALFVFRNYASLAVSQALDTVLFTFLGLYGLVDNVWHIIGISYAVKIVLILSSGPILALIRLFSRRLSHTLS